MLRLSLTTSPTKTPPDVNLAIVDSISLVNLRFTKLFIVLTRILTDKYFEMASIKITTIAPTLTADTSGYTYKDIHLDLTQSRKAADKRDLVAEFDYVAIKTSLNNLFNTIPGERVLTPTYGLDLRQFLFIPVTSQNALLLGNAIKSGIALWEPRVTISGITIITDADNNAYQINMTLELTGLNTSGQSKATVTLPGTLNTSGFVFLN